MRVRRILKNNTLRTVCVLGAVAFLASACAVRAVGHFSDLSGNRVSFSIYCQSGNLPNHHTCVGAASGVLDGKLFIGRALTRVGNLPDCSHLRCIGGSVEATGTGGLGGRPVTFDFSGFDGYPSPNDTVTVTITSGVLGVPLSYDFSCFNNCFTLITSQTNSDYPP